ncbi:MAG: hypothetical protein J7L89_06085 [Bacteroidales bacterium]|nr:hypothetical protein [Bacteroidales bacterium]
MLQKIGDALEAPWRWIDKVIALLPWSPVTIEKIQVKKYGVIGTILFHALVIVFFLIIKIGNPKAAEDSWIYLDLKSVKELAALETAKRMPEKIITPSHRKARNIAVNQKEDRIEKYDDYKNYRVSGKAVEQIVTSRINKAVNNIIKENNLNPNDHELPDMQTQPLDFFQAKKTKEEKIYEGPTNIYFNLANREVSYLNVPVYQCEGSATVRIDIRVNQRGKVELATVNPDETDTRKFCFIQAARKAARRTRFNFSTKAPRFQSGYITYHFVAQ